MERSGGEPDVVASARTTSDYDEFIFYDCAAKAPPGRRSLCFDRAAWNRERKPEPKNNAIDAAAAMGAELLTESQYRELQQLEHLRHKNLQLDRHSRQNPLTRRRPLLRPPLRHRLHLSQRRRILLRRPCLPLPLEVVGRRFSARAPNHRSIHPVASSLPSSQFPICIFPFPIPTSRRTVPPTLNAPIPITEHPPWQDANS